MHGMELLQKHIDDSGFKMQFVAKKCGITYQALKKKLDCEHEFKASEIAALKALLHLSDKDLHKIFFAQNVE